MMPQLAFAADAETSSSSIEWEEPWGQSTVGNVEVEWIILSGMDKDDIGFESTDESVIPENCIWAVNNYEIMYLPIKAGKTTITMYNKKDPTVRSKGLEFTISEATSSTVYTGHSRTLRVATSSPLTFKYRIEDESIASVDSEGTVTGIKPGETNLCITSDDVPTMELKKPINVAEDPTGIYYNDERVTELEWDKSQGTSVQLKAIRISGISPIDWAKNSFYDSSNTDVAEPVYGSAATHSGTGEITLKKNGTATIYVYSYLKRTELIGTIKLKVTGFDETTDPDQGWEQISEAQGMNSKIQLMDDYPIYNKTFNEAAYENKIGQALKADAVTFTLNFTSSSKVNGGSSATDMGYTEEQKTAWEKEVLSRINICKVNEDGTIGDVVASNGNGYQLKSSSHTAAKVDITLKLTVDAGVLNKGETYALVADPDVAAIESLEYYQTGINTFLPIGVTASWQFTTLPAASSITLDQTEATLKPGQDLALTAELDKNADDTLIWTSSDDAVASVDNDGKVTAKKVGTATITATAVDGKVSAECKVTVEPIKVTGITLDTAKATIYVGKTRTLKATVAPSDATYKAVTWTSSNSKVAKVDANGKVTAVAAGTATITAKNSDGTVTAKAVITVKNVAVTKVKTSASKATLAVGKTKTLKATVSPSNATNKAVTWTSSNKKVAKVSSKGKVTAVAPGTATITVTTKDGKFKAKTVINVKPKSTSFTLTAKKNSVVIKYKKISGVTGYQIYRAKSKNGTFKKITTRAQKKTGKYTSVRLSSKHTYYYKIRTYKTVNGKKIYSSFSAVKKIKTK
ncbi:Ig domain-containing protein [bacterium 210820-DFI.6.37]|nr:Ig domain-containing protein [bacterium 210820-DFI.6.37]